MSEAPLLYLPNGSKPSSGWKPQGNVRPKRTSLKYLEAFGRKIGATAGGYMDDLSSQKKAIWLCFKCRSKFNHRRAHYFYEKNLRVRGACDGCRTFDTESHLFIHESTLTDPGGKSRHGHVWTPRQGG